MGTILTKCCDKRQCNILMIGSEREIKHKLLKRNFEDFIKEEKGNEDFEEVDIQIDQNIRVKILDITADRLEEKYDKHLHKFNGIIYLSSPGYEEYDQQWFDSLRESNLYLSKFILFLIDPDSDLQLSEEGYSKQKVIYCKYDNDDLTEQGFNWITNSILSGRSYRPPTTEIQMS